MNSNSNSLGELLSLGEVKRLIVSGRFLTLAGDESILSQLPKGNWIGGTIPYFMGRNGGETTRDKLFVQSIDISMGLQPEIGVYDKSELDKFLLYAPENGYSVILLPAFSEVLEYYAENASIFEDMYIKPVIGWVAGKHLADSDEVIPKVFDGRSAASYTNSAIVMHCPLPENKQAIVDIINVFEPDELGPVITFTKEGFVADICMLDGKESSLSKYISENNISTKCPLIGDYNGEKINVSVKDISDCGKTSFYAPVYTGINYRFSKSVLDYAGKFTRAIPSQINNVKFSCNCVLNYLYSELEGVNTGNFTGPMTFGEIAYQLVNQTMAYLQVVDVKYQ